MDPLSLYPFPSPSLLHTVPGETCWMETNNEPLSVPADTLSCLRLWCVTCEGLLSPSLSLSPQTSVCRIKGFLPRNASNCHEGMEEIQASFSGVAWPGFVLHTSSHIYATMKTVGFLFFFYLWLLALLILCLEIRGDGWGGGGGGIKPVTVLHHSCCTLL